MFPLIGPLSAALTAVGAYALGWYLSLSKDEQQEADKLAAQYAKQLYNKTLDELTALQARRIHELLKGRFNG